MDRSLLDPRGCLVCKTACVRAVMFTVPAGWTRIVSPRTGEVVILCPEHRWGHVSQPD